MRYAEQDGKIVPDNLAHHRPPGRRRAAGLLARRHQADVDEQPHRGPHQPVVFGGF